MNRHRILAVASKEWREILRDRLFFALAFIVPAFLMLLFGYGLSLDVDHLPLGVVDYDRSAQSRAYVERFSASHYFRFYGQLDNERQAGELLSTNQLRAVIIIPPQFGRQLLSGQPAQVQTLLDGTFPSRALIAKGYITAINAAASLDNLASQAGQLGVTPEEARRALQPVRLDTRYLYNQSISSIWGLAPKLIMFILIASPPFLTALGVVREKERGSIFNLYASNTSRGEFLLGKLAPYVAISTLNILILWAMAVWLYHVPFKGSFGFFMLASVVYVLCTTGIGLLVSVLVRTQMAAMIVTLIVTLVPAILYSGFIIPIPSLKPLAQGIAHLMPAVYYTRIAVGCFLKGVGLAALWPELLILAAYAGALFTAGYLLFTKRPST